MHLLLVEDDALLAEHLKTALVSAGHQVFVSRDGQDGLHQALETDFDAIIVDRMLPKLDGLSLLKALRAVGNQVPAVFVSARSKVEDKIAGLKSGADDYMAKPVSVAELIARLEVVIARRQPGGGNNGQLAVGALSLNRLERAAFIDGIEVELQTTEFRILEYFMQHARQVITRTMLLEAIWDYNFDPQTNIVDVHISRLRRKLAAVSDTEFIHTVRGAGYVLKASD
ncbi:MAG: response regulator transcription factor [Pseudomonadota bacterium]